jgi:hypothetical protein
VTPEECGRVASVVLFGEWRGLIAAGYVTEAGLLAIRGRLSASNEFEPGPGRDLMLLDVEAALGMGSPLSTMPTDVRELL